MLQLGPILIVMNAPLAYVLQKRSYCRSMFYIAGTGIGIFDIFCFCDLDFDPMTFI